MQKVLEPTGNSGKSVNRNNLLLRRKLIIAALLLPTVVWILAFYVLPLGLMVWTGVLQSGVSSYADLFTSPLYLHVLWNTLEISIVTTIGTLMLGYPVAYALVVSRGTVRSIILLLVSLPYWLDYVVRSYSWMILLGRYGIINNTLVALGIISHPIQLIYNLFSVSVGMIQVLLPLMILTLFGAMLRIDRMLITAASIHGASGWRAFCTVFFPLSLPGVYAACLLVFISALGFYIIPALIGGPHQTMISQSIIMLAATLLRWNDASALSVVLMFFTFVLTALYDTVFSLDRLWGGPSREER